MSGTQDENFAAQNGENLDAQAIRAGSEKIEKTVDGKEVNTSEKMNAFIRGASPKTMHREIEKLRKESAKFRNSSKEESKQKLEIQEKAQAIQSELEALRAEHRSLKLVRALDKAGCVKSELVAKDIPQDCDDVDGFIEKYKAENSFLFGVKKTSHGGTFKPTSTVNLTQSQQIDRAIRQALGR